MVAFFSSKYVFDSKFKDFDFVHELTASMATETLITIFADIFGLSNVTANISAALCAVVMLHVALGMYIFKAYSKPTEVPEKPAKQD